MVTALGLCVKCLSSVKEDMPNLVTFLNSTPYLFGMWLDVAPTMDNKKTYLKKGLDHVLKVC